MSCSGHCSVVDTVGALPKSFFILVERLVLVVEQMGCRILAAVRIYYAWVALKTACLTYFAAYF